MSPTRKPLTLAARTARVPPSAVREILKVADRPDVLSFAGGLPAPELFPVEAIAQAHQSVLAQEGPQALQYSTTEGHLPLRSWLAERYQRQGVKATAESVFLTNGAQQGIDLTARVLLDPGATVIVENPTYLAALQVFHGYGAKLELVGSDRDGMRVDEVEAVLKRTKAALIYLVPDFHNPTGCTLSLERRQALVKLAARHHVAVLEDNPYGELRYRGQTLPSLAALDEAGVVITLGTFSKTLAPGLRLGWMHAPLEVIRAAVIARQSADLHGSTLAQRAAARLLETFDYDGHVQKLRSVYGPRMLAMLAAMKSELPAGTGWTQPDGGLFVWGELPEGLDATALFEDAVKEKVAFVPGLAFYAEAPDPRRLRLNFSNRGEADLLEGMRRLGGVVRAAMERSAKAPRAAPRTAPANARPG